MFKRLIFVAILLVSSSMAIASDAFCMSIAKFGSTVAAAKNAGVSKMEVKIVLKEDTKIADPIKDVLEALVDDIYARTTEVNPQIVYISVYRVCTSQLDKIETTL